MIITSRRRLEALQEAFHSARAAGPYSSPTVFGPVASPSASQFAVDSENPSSPEGTAAGAASSSAGGEAAGAADFRFLRFDIGPEGTDSVARPGHRAKEAWRLQHDLR